MNFKMALLVVCKLGLHPSIVQIVVVDDYEYRTRAIISRGLYIFYPIFKDHFFVFKDVFLENSVLMYGLYSRAASNQEWPMMARVRYIAGKQVLVRS